MAGRGGKREGAGRKPNSKNKRGKQLEAMIATIMATAKDAGELTPLDFLLKVLRNDEMPFPARFEAAVKAAPYLHPKLSNIEHSGGLNINAQDAFVKEFGGG